MNVLGIDFTSSPKPAKPITVIQCVFDSDSLVVAEMQELSDFTSFEALIGQPGPWIAGIDFPFGQSIRFIRNMQWPPRWAEYIDSRVLPLTRQEWLQLLDTYKADRPYGDKEHQRETDARNGAKSPQKLHGVPVGKMFFEGVQRLRSSRVFIPGLQECGDPDRWVVEAYPGVAIRALLDNLQYKQYKNDDKSKQTSQHRANRSRILDVLKDDGAVHRFGFSVTVEAGIAERAIEDGKGDILDALLCAVQATWAWRNRESNELRVVMHPAEGWIADPASLG